MLIYRIDEQPIDPRAAWRALVRAVDALPPGPPHDLVVSLLIDAGELEAAVADTLFPERDGLHPLAEALRLASAAAGRAFVASWQDRASLPASVADWRAVLGSVAADALPRRARRRVSEGYAYYALHPEAYAAAAWRFADAEDPAAVVCIGLRSIGASLAAVAAAALAARGVAARSFTVRPRGHPFSRELRLDADLEHVLRSHASHAHFLIVDEGPGLSGSSMTSAAAAIERLGVPPSRIALLPAWDADGSTFNSPAARATWSRHRRWVVASDAIGVGISAVSAGAAQEDWSGGRWRTRLLPEAEWPAAFPQHERVKRRLPEQAAILRFAGLGRYGAARQRRAALLAAGGFGPPPGPLEAGYLRLPYVPGAPGFRAAPAAVGFVARYCAFLARQARSACAPDTDALQEMIVTNCGEADPSMAVPDLARGAAVRDAPAIEADGRMLPHEFLTDGDRLAKVDALDHGADHFFPGPVDIAWDVAAAEMELRLDGSACTALLDAYTRLSGDLDIGRRLPFYRLAYASFQLGYATQAVQSLAASSDGRRFARRRDWFLDRVRALAASGVRSQ